MYMYVCLPPWCTAGSIRFEDEIYGSMVAGVRLDFALVRGWDCRYGGHGMEEDVGFWSMVKM